MFQFIYHCIFFAIIWLIIGEISFFCSKFTTIARYDWFSNFFYNLEFIAHKRLNAPKLGSWILNFSYSKIFYCQPCHSFWISLTMFYFVFIQIHTLYITLTLAFFSALMVYFTVKEAIERQKELNRNAEKFEQGATS